MLFRKMFTPKIYVKDTSNDPLFKSVNDGFVFKSRIMPALLMGVGVVVLGTQVVIPLFFFTSKESSELTKPVTSSVLGVASGFRDFEFGELRENAHKTTPSQSTSEYFYLTIPKLKIENAAVEINSTNLSPDKSLGHYNGSAIPGKPGNSFIYGHSVLPWFYNPKNYKTIFSTLNDLTTGDELFITVGGKTLTYKVESKELLKPNDVKPLDEFKPKYLNESTTTLMTCWPAGTKAKRLLVRGVLVD